MLFPPAAPTHSQPDSWLSIHAFGEQQHLGPGSEYILLIHIYACVCVVGGRHSVMSDSLWTVAHQAPLYMESSRQEYWSGFPFPSPCNLPDPGIKPCSPALQADSLLSESPGNIHIYIYICVCVCTHRIHMGFPGGAAVRNLPANEGDQGSIPGSGRSPREGNGNPFQYSSPEYPMDKGSWWATAHGVFRVGHDLATKQ